MNNLFLSISNFIKSIFINTSIEQAQPLIPISIEIPIVDTIPVPTISTESIIKLPLEPDLTMPIMIKDSTIKHLLDWESKHNKMYSDSVGVMTIGVGHAIFDKNEVFDGVKLISGILTYIQIDKLLENDLKTRVAAITQINKKIKKEIVDSFNQNQVDALVLFIFNQGSLWNVLSKAINDNYNSKDGEVLIKTQWRKYRLAGGLPSAGLINRREGEIDLFFNKYKGRNFYIKAKTDKKTNKIINPYY